MSLESAIQSFCSRRMAHREYSGNTPNPHETTVVPAVPVVPGPKHGAMNENEKIMVSTVLAHTEGTALKIHANDNCRRDGWVSCGKCRHFERIGHPHLGRCAQGETEAVAGLWDTDRRWCESYTPSLGNPDRRLDDEGRTDLSPK